MRNGPRTERLRDWLRFIPFWLSRPSIRREYHWTGERQYIRNLGRKA